MFCCLYFFLGWGVDGGVCTRLVGLRIIADKIKIYYHLRLGNMQKAHETIPCAYTVEFI